MKLRTLTAMAAVSALSLNMAACGKKAEDATPAADTAAADTAATAPSNTMEASPGTNSMATTQPTTPPVTDSMTGAAPATGSMATTPPATGSMAATPPVDTPPQQQTAPNSGSVPPK